MKKFLPNKDSVWSKVIFQRCHPNSDYKCKYIFLYFKCPLCYSQKLELHLNKTYSKKWGNIDAEFSCDNCGCIIGCCSFGTIKIKEALAFTLEYFYNNWESNKSSIELTAK